MFICTLCDKSFSNKHALTNHISRNKRYKNSNQPDCQERKRRQAVRSEASRILNSKEPEEIVETHDLLKQMSSRMDTVIHQNQALIQQNQTLQSEVSEIKQQNNEMKDIMLDIQKNPHLIVLCDKLYPLDALREINLKTPVFKPVLEILDKELPEYANLGNTQTQKAHTKAVRKFNQIQPTAVQEGESVYFKRGQMLSKDCSNDTTKEFINVFSINGYEYAQKASKDLESVRESDNIFQKEILNYATKYAFPGINEV